MTKSVERITGSGISLRGWQIYVNVWLVCLIFPIEAILQAHFTTLKLLVAVAGLGVFVAFYVWFMHPYPIHVADDDDVQYGGPLLAILLVVFLVLVLSAVYGSAFLWLLIGVSAVAGKTLPIRIAHLVTAVLPLVALGTGIVLSGNVAAVDWLHLLPLALLVRVFGVDMVGLSLLSSSIRELHETREELAQRRVNEERLRLARDLHDLLGHTLSLIVLKSELAGRLIEKKPQQAAKEIEDLETVARQSLREVRQAVAGYRQPTLTAELDGARQMLAAAGIDCVIETAVGELPPTIDTVLAWTVREGVTNVIRHSRAQVCTIHIGCDKGIVQAEVTNDGYAGQEALPIQLGSGLSGLTERITVQGGQLKAAPYWVQASMSFRLSIVLPITKWNETEEAQS